jgi:succinoglycan biosynthesis transport protein ExoP
MGGDAEMTPRLGANVVNGEPENFALKLWRTVKRRRALVLWTVAIVLALGAAAYFLWPTRYESKAELAFSFDSSDMIQLDDATLGSLGSNDADTKLSTQVSILQSDDLILTVVKDLDLGRKKEFYKLANPNINSSNLDPFNRERIIKEFGRRLKVKVVPKTYLVDVTFRNRDPKLAQAVLADLLTEYVNRSFQARYLDTQQAAVWLQGQIDSLRSDVETKSRELVRLQQQNGLLVMGLGTTGSETTAAVQLAEVIKAQVAAEADRIDKEAKYRASLNGDPELLASMIPGSKIMLMRQQQVQLQNQLTALQSQFGSKYPAVMTTKQQLDSANADIEKEVQKIQEQLKEQYQAATRGENLLNKSEEDAKQEAFKLNGAAAELVALQEEVDSGRRLYEGLERKLKEASVIAGLKSTEVDVVSKPHLPYKPAEPNAPIVFGLDAFFALILGTSLAVFAENTDRAVNTVYEVEEATGMPVLGTVPRQSGASAKEGKDRDTLSPSTVDSIVRTSPKAQVTEAFRTLRSALLLSAPTRPKVILVTSPLPGEGKSTITLGLATVLAHRQSRVLVIEADMRRPVLHNRLSFGSRNVGLSALLSGNSSFEESILTLPDMPFVTLLPAGRVPPYPAELLDSDKMTALLQRAREEYDFVMVDTPPVLSVADALPLAVQADITLLAIRSRVTRRRAMLDACNSLNRVGVPVGGIILNDVTAIDGAGYYYGHYDSYYGETSDAS